MFEIAVNWIAFLQNAHAGGRQEAKFQVVTAADFEIAEKMIDAERQVSCCILLWKPAQKFPFGLGKVAGTGGGVDDIGTMQCVQQWSVLFQPADK